MVGVWTEPVTAQLMMTLVKATPSLRLELVMHADAISGRQPGEPCNGIDDVRDALHRELVGHVVAPELGEPFSAGILDPGPQIDHRVARKAKIRAAPESRHAVA